MLFYGPHEKSCNFLQFSPYVWKVAKGLYLKERNILFVDRYVKQKHMHLDTDSWKGFKCNIRQKENWNLTFFARNTGIKNPKRRP